LARCRHTKLGDLATRATRQATAIGTESHAKDFIRMSPECRDFLSSLHFPEFHDLVGAARCQSLPIWTEGDSAQRGSMPPECKQLVAALRVPYLSGAVLR